MRSIIKQKQGAMVDLLVWIVVSFVIIVFFAFWIYGFGFISDKLEEVGTISSGDIELNFTDVTQDTFGKIESPQRNGLHVLAYTMIFIMGISILITNFLVKAHPAFFIIYVMVIIVGIIGSVYLSNTYEELASNALIGTELSGFTGASFIMIYLPVWVTVIGVFGAIFLFAGIMRDKGSGGSVI